MSYDMNDEERKLIEGVQNDLGTAKKRLRKLMKIQQDAERGAATQAVYASFVAVSSAHVVCSDRMLDCFPNDGPKIVLRGGGGR